MPYTAHVTRLLLILFYLLPVYLLLSRWSYHTDTDDDALHYTNIVIIYRGAWLVILYLFLCGVNIAVWEKYNINYLQIFGIELKSVSYHMGFFEAAAKLAFIWSVGIMIYLKVSTSGGTHTHSMLAFSPIAITFLFWLIILSPSNFFYKNARHWIFNHVVGFFKGPYVVTNFASCWVADQLTSATVLIVDFEYTICHYFFYIIGINCGRFHRLLQPICVAFPFVWRFLQCIYQYRETSQRSHLLNAGKYATSLVAIFLSTVHLLTQDDPNEWSAYRTYWVVVITMSTIYSNIWDVMMDWGLFKKNETTKKWGLRENLIYGRPWIYYAVMVSNLFMRATWMITLNPEYFGIHFRRDILVFFLSSVELIRRIQWNFFRMEWEQVNKFHQTLDPKLQLINDVLTTSQYD